MSISELWKFYKSTSSDSVKVNTLWHLATQYTRVNPDSAVLLANAAVKDAQENKLVSLEAHAYTSLGEAYDVSSKIDLSLENFEKAINIFQKLNHQDGLGRVYNSRGVAYYYSGKNDEALNDFLVAKNIFADQKDLAQVARNLQNLGLAYGRSKEDNAVYLALSNYLKARNIKDSLIYLGSTEIYKKPDVPPCIQIKLVKQDDEVVFRVKDNGMGITEKEHSTLFKPFHRLHKRMQSGSGLGLAICQKVVQSYGGKIWHEAVPEGGSVFCFTMPKA